MKYKKSYSHIREKSLDHIVAFIVKFQDTYPIKTMCKVLKIQRSTYYKKLHHKPSNREIENKKLDEVIKEIYYANKKPYGAPKIQKVLLSKTIKISLKRVQISPIFTH